MLTTIFTKLPQPGLAKTRLCPPLSPDEAARLAEAMLRDVVEELRGGAWSLTLSVAPSGEVSPAERESWFRTRFGDLEFVEQRGADLGARLASHFEEVFASGACASAVVVGSDVPELRRELVDRAHAWLAAGADVVFGPDAGGGYYLVGMRRSVPALFTRVPMSTPEMLRRTLELARELGLAVRELPVVGDVDTEVDLERLRRHSTRLPAHTRDCLQGLELS